MRTIPTILAAAAIAIGPAVLFTAPTAHADYVCTGPGGNPITFVGNSNLCYGGGTLITPAGPQKQNVPPPQNPPPQNPPPQNPPPQNPPPQNPPPQNPPPAGASPTDCANPAFAAAYNFYCADVGPGGPAPAPGANPQAINQGVEGGLGNTPAVPAVPGPVIAQNDAGDTAAGGAAITDQPQTGPITAGAADVLTNGPCLAGADHPSCDDPTTRGEAQYYSDDNPGQLCGTDTATHCHRNP